MTKEEPGNSPKPPSDFRQRTRAFSIRIVRVCEALPKGTAARVFRDQLLRSATSVGAHYREASRARSAAEFVSKLNIGVQELDETLYWLELIVDAGLLPKARLALLHDEAEQLMRIMVTMMKNAKGKQTGL